MNILHSLRAVSVAGALRGTFADTAQATEETQEETQPLPAASALSPASAAETASRREEHTLGWGIATDPNRAARESQQDAAALMRLELAHPSEGFLRVTVAGLFDGAGGHAAGEEASAAAAVEILPGILSRIASIADIVQVPDLLREQIWDTNRRIYASTSRRGGAATTLALALILEGQWLGRHLWVAHIGDSRIYAVTPGGDVTAVTRDHSHVAALVQAGELTPEEALAHPDSNLITAALGAAPVPAACDVAYASLAEPLALVLLCDGIWGPLLRSEAQHDPAMPCFHDYLTVTVWRHSPQEAAQQLVMDALRLGGDDNATAAILRFGDAEPSASRHNDMP